MALSWPVVVAVLFGAMLHASWNALVKSSSDKDLDMAVIHLIGSFLAIPLVVLAGWPAPSAWPFIGASVVIHIGYYLALTGAYSQRRCSIQPLSTRDRLLGLPRTAA